MSKVLIVGDTHFQNRIPISRKDDYPNTLINKLKGLGELIEKYQVSDCIFLGDLFNTKNLDLAYFTSVFNTFKQIKDKTHVKFYTIVGNHDLLYRNRELLVSSPITLLTITNVFEQTKELDTLNIGGVDFTFADYTLPVDQISDATSDDSVFIGHYFFDNGWGDTSHTLTHALCKKLGYKFYFLGHDHTPYEPLIKGYQIHRPGSFSRGTSESCQVKRDNIQVCLFDTNFKAVSYLDLPNVLSSKAVYRDDLLINKALDTSLSSLSEDFSVFLDAFKYDGTEDILNTLDKLQIDPQVKELLLKYLRLGGLIS